jgi:hypothetical protein
MQTIDCSFPQLPFSVFLWRACSSHNIYVMPSIFMREVEKPSITERFHFTSLKLHPSPYLSVPRAISRVSTIVGSAAQWPKFVTC